MVTFDEIEKADVADLSIRTRVEAFYKGTDAISEFAESVMVPIIKGQLDLTDREKAVVGTYLRMYAWIRSLVVMNSRIHFQGAAAAARALFELLLDLKLLGRDMTSESVEKFHAFPEVEKFRVANNLVSFSDKHPTATKLDITYQRDFVDSPGREQNIKETIIKNWGVGREQKPKRPRHWTGRNIRDRAHDLGFENEELYIEAYPLLSWYIHSGSTGYEGLDENALEASFGLSHMIAQKVFLEATLICSEEMQISYAVEGLPEILEDLRLTPGKMIIQEQVKILEEAKERASSQS